MLVAEAMAASTFGENTSPAAGGSYPRLRAQGLLAKLKGTLARFFRACRGVRSRPCAVEKRVVTCKAVEEVVGLLNSSGPPQCPQNRGDGGREAIEAAWGKARLGLRQGRMGHVRALST